MLLTLIACTGSPPETPGVVLGPLDPTTAEDLIASVDPVTDPDGDEVTLVYRWFRDAVEVEGQDSDTLPSSETAKGETWMVRVYATDGDNDSESASAEVTVVNAVPSLTIDLDAKAPSSDDVVAVAVIDDPDEDEHSIVWAWALDGVPGSTTDTLPADDIARGEVWTVTATVDDGEASSEEASAEVIITNGPPKVTELTLSPEEPLTADTLEASYEVVDSDGDAFELTWSWSVDGVTVDDEVGETLDGAFFAKGETVSVHLVGYDDEDEGETATASVEIGNTPPAVVAAQLSPSPVYTDSTVSCVGYEWSDADEDPEAYTVVWSVDGAQVSTADTLDGSYFDRHNALHCELTPHDGTDAGEPVSTWQYVANSPPLISSITLSPTAPEVTDTVTATIVASDADGDSLSYRYDWYVGAVWAEGTEELEGAFFNKGQDIWLEIRATDTEGERHTLTSNVVTAVNTAPVASGVSLPTTVYTDDTLVATTSASDANDDTLSWSYDWYVESSLATTTSIPRLEGSTWFDKDDEVYVIATPSDDEDTGNAVTSSTLTILNSPPPAPTVSLPGRLLENSEDLICSISQDDPDPDGDTLTYTIAWEVDGTAFTNTSTTTNSGDTVDADETNHGERWVCTVTPDDSEDEGDPGEDSALITNTCDTVTALTFDNDYGTLGGTGMMDRSTGSMEAWIYPTDAGTLFSMRGSAGHVELHVSSTGEVVQRTVTSNGCSNHSKPTTATVEWDAWNHIAWTADGFGVSNRVCIDGVCETFTGNALGVWGSCLGNETLYIGARSGSSNYFDGAMEDLRIWSDSRTTTEIQDNMLVRYDDLTSTSGLMAWYTFDGDLTDEHGSYDGTWYGSTSDYEDYDWCD